jgi:hypothetical protein
MDKNTPPIPEPMTCSCLVARTLERKIASQKEVIRQKSAQISRLQDTIQKLREGESESQSNGGTVNE